MANSETGTSTSTTSTSVYQVFLSFRGADTRRGFTSSLYHALIDAGIYVFIDDEELRPGETISGSLLQAINDSKLYIPIFSKDYASSHWCLRELAKMVENTYKSKEDGKNKVILPIFYDVEPKDVKLKTTLYNDAISNLEHKEEDQKKFSSEDIKMWRLALKEVAAMKGWELEKFPGHGDLIKLVVNEVVINLKTKERELTADLIGMKDQIATINNLLDIDSDVVRLIGIYGMGGIGKTTLAKIIFNQHCPRFGKHCSFLDDVRETAQTKGLDKLQTKLLSDISHSRRAHTIDNIDNRINMITGTIYNKKVLIVLDDVAEANQIQKLIGKQPLYPGTRILVTTRDKSVMNIKTFNYEFEKYEMVRLSEEEALVLFSRHAFNVDYPPNDYYTLSRRIVSTADGLPLALEAIGSSLYGKRRKTWEEWLKKLKKTLHKDVSAKLQISYDDLEPHEKEIFLDIACFLVGENKTNAMYMWEDCDFYPEDAIEVLINRCMIKELDDHSLWMHDQFKDLGRKIAKEYCTRLWDEEDIIDELRSTEVKGNVQALRLKSRDLLEDPITSEQIKRFPRIRFLSLCEVICQGDFTGCLSKLKWISLDYGYVIPPRPAAHRRQWFEATNSLHLENLVVVNFSGIDITEVMFNSLIKGAKKLKVLTVCYNTSIQGTPTFPQYSVLEKLTISKFLKLIEIDCSIGKLTKLIDLRFESCVGLEKLPEKIGELQHLQHLSLRSCGTLSALPDSVLKLKSLMKLDVSCTRITRLPDSIGTLSSLLSIDVSFTPIKKLPTTMSKLRLQTLCLNHCDQLQQLPELPESLTTLQLISTSLLPNLSCLPNLVDLAMSNVFKSMAKSDKIETCDSHCVFILEERQYLISKLYGLPKPPFSLITVQQISTLLVVPNLECLSSLVDLGVPNVFESIAGLEKIETYDLQWSFILEEQRCLISKFTLIEDRRAFLFRSFPGKLKKFVLWGCSWVQDIQLVSTLELLLVFSIGECASLKRLGGLSKVKNLMELTLNQCRGLQLVEGINGLEFLHQLKIDRCTSMERIFDPLSSKIPNMCSIFITGSGKLPDSGPTLDTWESYKEKILSSEGVFNFAIAPHFSSNSILILEDYETKGKTKRTFDCFS